MTQKSLFSTYDAQLVNNNLRPLFNKRKSYTSYSSLNTLTIHARAQKWSNL